MIKILCGIALSTLLIAFALWLCTKIYRKTIIKKFANELAKVHKAADVFYGEEDIKTWALDNEYAICSLAARFGILDQVYEEANKIYEFRKTTTFED